MHRSLFLSLGLVALTTTLSACQNTPALQSQAALQPQNPVAESQADLEQAPLTPSQQLKKPAPHAAPPQTKKSQELTPLTLERVQRRIQGQVSGYTHADQVEVIITVWGDNTQQEFKTTLAEDGSYQFDLPPGYQDLSGWVKAHELGQEPHRGTWMVPLSPLLNPASLDSPQLIETLDLTFEPPPEPLPAGFTEADLNAYGPELFLPERSHISGQVYTSDHQILDHAHITIRSLNDSVPFFTELSTDQNGRYEAANIPSGVQIEIMASKPGFAITQRVEVMKSCGGHPDRNTYDFGTAATSDNGSENPFGLKPIIQVDVEAAPPSEWGTPLHEETPVNGFKLVSF